MADKAVYYVNPVIQEAQLPATANTARDGTGTLTEVARGSASKIRKIDTIYCKMSLANAAASQIVFFYSGDGGTTKRVMPFEAIAPITTLAGGAASFEVAVNFQGFPLMNDNARIYAAPYTAQLVNTLAVMYEP